MWALFESGEDQAKARILCEKILSVNPVNLEILHLYRLLCIDKGAFSKAVEYLRLALKERPDHPDLLYDLGWALIGLERWDEAFEPFKRVVHLKPDHVEAYCQLGRILLRRQKTFEAAAEFEKAVNLNPEHAQAHEQLSVALRSLQIFPLAHYHQILALYYEKKIVHDLSILPPQHTFFLDREKAQQTARQGHRVTELVPNSGSQNCYYFGELFLDAPSNLIHVPSKAQAFLAFFLHARRSPPVMIDFDPSVASERLLAGRIASNLYQCWVAQREEMVRLDNLCQATRPEFVPGEPLRIFLPASRMTTVGQYNARDLAEGFKRHGCEVLFLIEANDREALSHLHWLQEQQNFNPHAVIEINRLNESLHPDVFSVTWWQDMMPDLMAGQPLPWRKRGLIYASSKELDALLHNCEAPHIHRQGFCYDERIFRNLGQKRKRKVVVVASSYRGFLVQYPKFETLRPHLKAMFLAGEPMTDLKLAWFAQNSVYSEKEILFFLWGYLVRDQSVRWLCTLSDDIEVEVYGRHWEEDSVVHPFFKGTLPHGPAVAAVYNEALYALVPHPFDLQSQRLVETAVCGAIPIVYDCRYRASEPYWDDCCLWYRTKEDMRACLTGQPQRPPHTMAQGRSYVDFARRILMEITSIQTQTNPGFSTAIAIGQNNREHLIRDTYIDSQSTHAMSP